MNAFDKVKINTIIGGLILQAVFGLFVMRSKFGYQLFRWIGEEIKKFLFFTDNGTRLVFGNINDHYFAFRALYLI